MFSDYTLLVSSAKARTETVFTSYSTDDEIPRKTTECKLSRGFKSLQCNIYSIFIALCLILGVK